MKKYILVIALGLGAVHSLIVLGSIDHGKKFESPWKYASPTLWASAGAVGLGTLGYLAYQLHRGSLNSWDIPVFMGGVATASICKFASNWCNDHILELKNKFRKNNFYSQCSQNFEEVLPITQNSKRTDYVAQEVIAEKRLWFHFHTTLNFAIALTGDEIIKRIINQTTEQKGLMQITLDSNRYDEEDIGNLLDRIPEYSKVVITVSQGSMSNEDFCKLLDKIRQQSSYTKKFLVVGEMSDTIYKKYICIDLQISKETNSKGNIGGYKGLAEDYFDGKIGKDLLDDSLIDIDENWYGMYTIMNANTNQLEHRERFINNICEIAVEFRLHINQFLSLLEIINKETNHADRGDSVKFLDGWKQYDYWQWDVIYKVYVLKAVEFLVNDLGKNRSHVEPIIKRISDKNIDIY